MGELASVFTKNCALCGHFFSTTNISKMYCSQKCSLKVKNKENVKRLRMMSADDFISKELDKPVEVAPVTSLSMRFMIAENPFIILKVVDLRRMGLDIHTGSVIEVAVSVALK